MSRSLGIEIKVKTDTDDAKKDMGGLKSDLEDIINGDHNLEIGVEAGGATKSLKTLGDIGEKVFAKLKKGFKYVANEVQSVDDALTSVLKVVDDSDMGEMREFDKFSKNIYKLASDVGSTAEEFAVGVERWKASGHDMAESIELARKSTMGAFVGDIDEAKMVKFMSVPLQAFQREGLKAHDILNAMNEVSNNTAVEMVDLGEAFERSAASVGATGTSFAELTSLITAAEVSTRSGGARIGTALNSVGTQINKIAAAGTKDMEKRRDFFKSIGVDLLDSAGEIRSTYDVIQDLVRVYDQLDSVARAQSLDYLAGKSHANILEGIIQGWEHVADAKRMAEEQIGLPEGIGSAYDEFESQSQTVSFAMNKLTNSWKDFITSLTGGKSSIIGVLNTLQSGLDGITKFVSSDAGGAITGIVGKLTTLFATISMGATVFSKLKDFGTGLRDILTVDKGLRTGRVLTGFGKGVKWFAILATVREILMAFEATRGFVVEFEEGVSDFFTTTNTQLRKSVESANEIMSATSDTLAQNKNYRDVIQNHKDLARSYEELRAGRQKTFEETGDFSQLKMTTQEFENIKNSHNELVKQLGLPISMRIEFNDSEHIESKLDSVKEKYEELQDTISRSDAKALEEATSANRKVIQTYKEEQRKYEEAVKEVEESYKRFKSQPSVESVQEVGIRQSYANRLKKELENFEEEYGDVLQEFQGQMIQMGNMAAAQMDKVLLDESPRAKFQQTVGRVSELGRDLAPTYYMHGVESLRRYINYTKEASSELKNVKGNVEEVANAFDAGAEVDQSKLMQTYNALDSIIELFKDSPEVKKFTDEYGALADILERGDGEALRKLYSTLGSIVDDSSKDLESYKNLLRAIGKEANLSEEEITRFINSLDSDSKGDFVRGAFLADIEAAGVMFGISANGIKALRDEAGRADEMSVHEFVKDIQEGIESLPDEIALEFNLKTADGIADFDKIMSDFQTARELVGDKTDLLVEFGVIEKDGSAKNVENLYKLRQIVEHMPTEVKTALGFDVSESVEFEDFLQRYGSGEFDDIDVDIKFNADTGEFEWLLDGKKVDAGTITAKVDVEYEIDTDIHDTDLSLGWDAATNKEHIKKLFVRVQPQVVTEEGELDMTVVESLIKQNIGDKEFREQVKVHLGIDIDEDGFDLMEFSDAMAHYGSIEEQIELMIKLFTKTDLDSSDVDSTKEKLLSDVEGEPVEATVQTNINAEPNVQNAAEAGQQVEQEVQDATPDQVEASTEVNITVDELEEQNLQDLGWSIESFKMQVVDAAEESPIEISPSLKFNLDNYDAGDIYSEVRRLITVDNEVIDIQVDFQLNDDGTTEIVNTITEKDGQKVSIDIVATDDGNMAKISSDVDELDGKVIRTQGVLEYDSTIDKVKADLNSLEEPKEATVTAQVIGVAEALSIIQEFESAEINVTGTIDVTDNASGVIKDIQSSLNSISDKDISLSISVDSESVDGAFAAVTEATFEDKTVNILGDSSDFDATASSVEAVTFADKVVYISANASAFWAEMNAVRNASAVVPVTIEVTRRNRSIAIDPDSVGRALSMSVGEALLGRSASTPVKGGHRLSSKEEAKVDEAVWRYWATELYKGTKLDYSIDELSRRIKLASDDNKKLIELYREQQALIRKQMEHETEMAQLRRQEIFDILGKLSGYGFISEGYKITNLGHAKSLSGDSASEADKLLKEWRKLYEELAKYQTTIGELRLKEEEAKKDERQARVDLEREHLESMRKVHDAYVKVVENNMSIASKAISMVDSQDYNLMIAVNEQGITEAAENIRVLLREFEKLQNHSITYEENYEEFISSLERSKDLILDNADAIMQYRNQIAQTQIDRLIGDFNKFSNVMDKQVRRVESNIRMLQEGLVSGTTLSDMASAKMPTLIVSRKDQLRDEQRFRLRLERTLSETLDRYANHRMDMYRREGKTRLEIQQNVINEMFKMEKAYTQGRLYKWDYGFFQNEFSGVEKISNDFIAANQYARSLEKATRDYYNQQRNVDLQHDIRMRKAKTEQEVEMIHRDTVLKKLDLQRKNYERMIDIYKETARQAEIELRNTELTTSQREQLTNLISEQYDQMASAEQSIQETVKARYDYEFTMLDKLAERSKRYADNVSYFLDIARLVNLPSDKMAQLYNIQFASFANQYTQAKGELQKLNQEQAKFEKHSLEWNKLEERIRSTTSALREYSRGMLSANKNALSQDVNALRDKYQRDLYDGKTLDAYRKFQDGWYTGIQKEIHLEKLRKQLLDDESSIIKERLEMLDRQEAVSKKDVEYLDKQLKIQNLQHKLRGIEERTNIQTLKRQDDGTWDWEYVHDQTEYDKVYEELTNERLSLGEFIEAAKKDYGEDLDAIMTRVDSDGYSSVEELQQDLMRLQQEYGMVLSDIPDWTGVPLEELVSTYQNYLTTSQLIAEGVLADEVAPVSKEIEALSYAFETSAMNILPNFAAVIAEEFTKALQRMGDTGFGQTYNIGALEFPNVENADEVMQVFDNLENYAKQYVAKK